MPDDESEPQMWVLPQLVEQVFMKLPEALKDVKEDTSIQKSNCSRRDNRWSSGGASSRRRRG